MKCVGYRFPDWCKVVSLCANGGHLWALMENGDIYQVESICSRLTATEDFPIEEEMTE